MPIRSCSLPGTCGSEQPPSHKGFVPAWLCSRRGLPGCRITADTGGLLHHHFTLASGSRRENQVGGMFLWPDPAGCPAPGVSPASCSVECGLSSALLAQSRDHPISLSTSILHGFDRGVNMECADHKARLLVAWFGFQDYNPTNSSLMREP